MKDEPSWIPLDLVERLHSRALDQFGGAPGIRDHGLLESALARPRNIFAYGAADLAELASAYAYAITQNHPFIDGNKRVAFAVAISFLRVHGQMLDARESEATEMMQSLSAGEMNEIEFTNWLRTNLRQVPPLV